MRLPGRPGERIDRHERLAFSYGGRTIEAFRGDTIGSALWAAGERVFSRSFKYHRPRGLYCCSGDCASCLMEVDGVPSVRVCVQPVRGGEQVRAQVGRGSLARDPLVLVDRLGGPFTPVGFYYRTLIRPRRAWPHVERLLRAMTGVGRIDGALALERFDTEHRQVEVLVIGGGRAGRAAASRHATRGRSVALVDERDDRGGELPGVEVITPGRALAVYEGNLIPVQAGRLLIRFRAQRIVFATGALDQPLVFAGNDLPGVMTPGAVRRLIEDWRLAPGRRAVVVAPAATALAELLRGAGTDVLAAVDVGAGGSPSLRAVGRRGRLTAVALDGRTLACDLLVASAGRQPAYSLLAQAGVSVEYDPGAGVFVPRAVPEGVEVAGSATGDGVATVPPPDPSMPLRGGRCFVCLCEDVTVKDVKRAVLEGFESIELAKRYTTVTMGPCQGRLCQLTSIKVVAQATGEGEAAIGTTTARPPWSPTSLATFAGRHHAPGKRTPMHGRHEELGCELVWTGNWRRPHSYTDHVGETRAVHESAGAIDVSSLGKLLVSGPGAVAFLERAFPNRFETLAVGRVRYAVLNTDTGRIIDDGTVIRVGEEDFVVTTTSTGVDVVFESFQWWRDDWDVDVRITNVSSALAGIAVSGPAARTLMERLTSADVSNEAFPYLHARQLPVAGVPALVIRIGFVGELGYEFHFPAAYGEYVWDTVLEQGAPLGIRPYGVESLKTLRLEKMHILVGQDTDSESNMLEQNLGRMVGWDKDRFVGKTALVHLRDSGERRLLVGFRTHDGTVPREGTSIVAGGRPIGRVTSSRWSVETGAAIGLGFLPPELATDGRSIQIDVEGGLVGGTVQTTPFFDPDGTRLRS
jgi:sarcosine oxidase subunit alpha